MSFLQMLNNDHHHRSEKYAPGRTLSRRHFLMLTATGLLVGACQSGSIIAALKLRHHNHPGYSPAEVEALAQHRTRHGEQADRSTWPVRDAEANYPSNPLRPQERCIPGDPRSPIVTDHHRLLLVRYINEADDVADQLQLRVRVDLCWGGQLVPPRIPRLGKTIQQ